jgi:hypothetical protein
VAIDDQRRGIREWKTKPVEGGGLGTATECPNPDRTRVHASTYGGQHYRCCRPFSIAPALRNEIHVWHSDQLLRSSSRQQGRRHESCPIVTVAWNHGVARPDDGSDSASVKFSDKNHP